MKNILISAALLFRAAYWKHVFSVWEFLRGCFEALGSIYLVSKLMSWFLKSQFDALITGFPIALPIAIGFFAICTGAYRVRPRRSVSCSMQGRDVRISIEVGDLFATRDALIIGTNRTFDTELADHLISEDSTQGQFTKRYYKGQHLHLDADLQGRLNEVVGEQQPERRTGKQVRYPIGTVAMVRPADKAGYRRAYLVAIAELNDRGRAQGTMEDLRNAMGSLWSFISESGGMEPLRVPVLGTGFSRLTEQRAEIIRELVNSFVAACSDRKFCESLTVVISPKDYGRYNIDIDELGRYLKHVCQYTKLGRTNEGGRGEPIGIAEETVRA